MSVDAKKSRKKKLNPENELVSKFFNKKQDCGEPATKKNKVTNDVNNDDSLRFFKTAPNLRKIAESSVKDSACPSNSKDNVVSDFINKPSTSKQAKKAAITKPKRVTKPKKPKSQTDIRKALNKKDEMIYHAINESCTADGVDPFEMQLALAISESLKDVNKEQQHKDTKSFDNPFNSSGKIQPINSVLEHYGFKSKKVYSEYEMEMLLNNKSKKRTKHQKFPTLLTNTTDDKRNEMITTRIHDILDSYLFANTQQSEKEEITKIEKNNPVVYCNDFMNVHELVNTAFRRSSECMVHADYFVTELFEIAHNKPGYLLKDWSEIAGRDASPVKELKRSCVEVTGNQNFEPSYSEIKKNPIQVVLSPNSSCSDIFEGIESFTMDQLGETQSEESLKAVNEHLELLHEKLSQSIVMHQDNDNLSDKNKMKSVDLTQDESTNSESTQEYIYDPQDSEEQEEVDQISSKNQVSQICNNDDNEIFDLTQCDSLKKEDIINRENEQSQEINSDAILDEEQEFFDLTQCESYKAPNMVRNTYISQRTAHDEDEIFDFTQRDSPKSLSKSSTVNSFDENEVINISDDEINYSINRCQESSSNSNEYPSNSNQTQKEDDEVIDIDNLAEHSLIDMIAKDEKDVQIENSVSELLNNFSEINKSFNYSRKNRSIKFMETENLGDSITDIMRKYGVIPVNSPKHKNFSKIHSESDLERFSSQKSIEQDNDVDLTVINDFSSQNDSQEEEDSEKIDMSINKSLANILKSPITKQSVRLSKEKPRKSLGIIMNDKYVVDTETLFVEPDFENMTPHELKLQLFKYGIRPLPVKKAVQILTHIYYQMHPLIRVAIDEEIDMNDSRKDMNITDVATDIGMKGDDDEYVFQLDQSGIFKDEEYILPNVRKSKVPSCLIPLHISFYNMVRSNDKLQKYILEYRPVELDQIYKHFRKFGLTYQTNDIIAFLDKRCITFKTKEQSCSKKHERKKQKRTQKS
ncbi:unnamed protein product [Chironomus riparius]|uniref:Structure-specific endonuclease subunit SLX4 n=1 Tax=Chironomus riparius TaxID=315576 RepID=A0A9N9WM44_9DIPT|nr:unnamed protein product [Chironomus riparius]